MLRGERATRQLAAAMLSAVAACSSSALSGVKDAAPGDAPGPPEVSAETAAEAPAEPPRDPGHQQWLYPECETGNGRCPEGRCRPAVLNVSPAACGDYATVRDGCLPMGNNGTPAACFVRVADGQVIITADAPFSMEGLEPCADGNMPSCPGGGGFHPVRDPGYEDWTFPACETTDGSCPSDACYRPTLTVSPTMCGDYSSIKAGCRPIGVIVAGVVCYKRVSDGEYIFTPDTPYSMNDVETCGLRPVCPDGGGL